MYHRDDKKSIQIKLCCFQWGFYYCDEINQLALNIYECYTDLFYLIDEMWKMFYEVISRDVTTWAHLQSGGQSPTQLDGKTIALFSHKLCYIY